jgi:hypothetical protein
MAAAEYQEDQDTPPLEDAGACPRYETWNSYREPYDDDTVRGVLLVFGHVKRRYKTDLPNPAKARIKGFVINEARIAILTEDEDDAIQTRVRLVNPQTGVTGLDRTFNERNIQIARVALQGPLADEMPHYELVDRHRQDIVTAPSKLEVWRASSCRTEQRHLYVWPPREGHGDYAVRALDPCGKPLTFPASLRGLRWVVEDGVARLHVGRLDGHQGDDGAVVIERRGGFPPWVRAGIGSVVSAKCGWAAVVGSHFVECFQLETGDLLLHTEFDARPLGRLWLAVADTMLVVSLPDGDLVVFGPTDAEQGSVVTAVFGQGFELGFREVSRYIFGPGAYYAACGDVLAIALEDIQLFRLHPETGLAPRGSVAKPFRTTQLPEGTDYVTQLALAADHVIACVRSDEGDSILWAWQGGEEEPSVRVDPPMGPVEATVVAFGDAAIDQMLQDADKVAAQVEEEDAEDEREEHEAVDLEDEVPELTQEMAAFISMEMWASRVERRLHAERRLARGAPGIAPPEAAGKGAQLRRNVDGVVLLTFSRHPRELDEALFGSSAACGASDRGVHTRPAWANGAKVFVEGLRRDLLAAAGVEELCPRHVLVKVEDEDSVHAALQTLSYRIRPRLKPGFGRRVLGNWVKSASGSSDLFRDPSDMVRDGEEEAAGAAAEDAPAAETGAAPNGKVLPRPLPSRPHRP